MSRSYHYAPSILCCSKVSGQGDDRPGGGHFKCLSFIMTPGILCYSGVSDLGKDKLEGGSFKCLPYQYAPTYFML